MRARWSGAAIVICAQGVAPVRVRDSAEVFVLVRDGAAVGIHRQRVDGARAGDLVRVRDGAAVMIHRHRVDGARVGDGAAVVICSQDVVPCPVVRVVSCRVVVMSRHVMSCCDVKPCHVGSRRIMSSLSCHVTSRTSPHVMPRHVMSCHVMSCHVMSCHVMSCHVTPCHGVSLSCRVLSCRIASCCEGRPQHIDAATSLSHYAHSRRSQSHRSYSYHSCSHSLHSHHSH